ncbi:heme ABC transporter permease [Roseiterribacter gracilis]|uniref:heme ABC transporter permease n=1 Tax=Roseiterribacter gracilis TaxID=2812848 RepID=UPI003B4364E4
MHRFANPARFLRIARVVTPLAGWIAVATLLAGAVFGLVLSPPDYQQSETVRIMYVHVPSAWLALQSYIAMALAAAVALVWKHPLADLFVKAAAPVGAGFTLLCLITGSFWGRPTWGAWWVWDARLTSMLVLLFLYVGYMALAGAFDDEERGHRAGAVLVLTGIVDVPIVKFSVEWWNTLHQPTSVFRLGGPTIASEMLWPLGLMVVGFTAFFVWIVCVRLETELLHRKIRARLENTPA